MGLGSELMAELENWAKRGFTRLELTVMTDNEPANSCTHTGFEIEGTKDAHFDGSICRRTLYVSFGSRLQSRRLSQSPASVGACYSNNREVASRFLKSCARKAPTFAQDR